MQLTKQDIKDLLQQGWRYGYKAFWYTKNQKRHNCYVCIPKGTRFADAVILLNTIKKASV